MARCGVMRRLWRLGGSPGGTGRRSGARAAAGPWPPPRRSSDVSSDFLTVPSGDRGRRARRSRPSRTFAAAPRTRGRARRPRRARLRARGTRRCADRHRGNVGECPAVDRRAHLRPGFGRWALGCSSSTIKRRDTASSTRLPWSASSTASGRSGRSGTFSIPLRCWSRSAGRRKKIAVAQRSHDSWSSSSPRIGRVVVSTVSLDDEALVEPSSFVDEIPRAGLPAAPEGVGSPRHSDSKRLQTPFDLRVTKRWIQRLGNGSPCGRPDRRGTSPHFMALLAR